jgi:hypothetical protein
MKISMKISSTRPLVLLASLAGIGAAGCGGRPQAPAMPTLGGGWSDEDLAQLQGK